MSENKVPLEGELSPEEQREQIKEKVINEMREKHGPHILAKRALEEIRKKKNKKAVIDGIRNISEIAFLEKIKGFCLIGIDTSPKVRYERLLRKHGKKYAGSYKDFLTQEMQEERLGSKNTGLRVKECLKKATHVVKNNGSIKDLQKNIDTVLQKIC